MNLWPFCKRKTPLPLTRDGACLHRCLAVSGTRCTDTCARLTPRSIALHELGSVILGVLLLMGVITLGSTATGKGKELCDAMGGKYTPGAQERASPPPTAAPVCPGGRWGRLIERPA